MKKIWLYMVAYNEEMLLKTCLNYYQGKVDRVIVYDHMSTDSTADIVRSYGGVVRQFDTGGVIDDEVLLNIKNTAWKEAIGIADAVIVSDVDEIIYHPQFNNHVENVLNAGFTLMDPKYAFMPTTYSENLEDLVGKPDACRAKQLMFDPNKISDINYCIGAHSSSPVGHVKINRDFCFVHSHYSLGPEEVTRRREVNATRLSKKNIENGWGVHYTYAREKTFKEYEAISQDNVPFLSYAGNI